MLLQGHFLRVTLFYCPEGVTVSGEDCICNAELIGLNTQVQPTHRKLDFVAGHPAFIIRLAF